MFRPREVEHFWTQEWELTRYCVRAEDYDRLLKLYLESLAKVEAVTSALSAGR